MLTIVYAKCSRNERLDLWHDITALPATDLPWMVGGDFNFIVDRIERSGGAPPDAHAMTYFASFIIDCGLIDIGVKGLPFTWEGSNISQRLDRLLFNQKWLETFSQNEVTHGIKRCSDHRPLILCYNILSVPKSSQFRFQDMWLLHPDFKPGIKNHWDLPARNRGMRN